MDLINLTSLNEFIVKAKSACYVGGGQKILPSRPGSHDLQFSEGDWNYHDCYFGGSDFIGEEAVYCKYRIIWVMNYYGKIIQPSLITAGETGRIIMASLSKMYQEGRFLGGFNHLEGDDSYFDTNNGDITSFTGREWIMRKDKLVYELHYHGGLIKD